MSEVTLTAPNGQNIKLSTGLFINNEFVRGTTGETLSSIDPATEETIVEIELGNVDDVNRAVRAARTALDNPDWRDMLPEDRAKLLYKLADLIDEHSDELFALQAWDVGKPFKKSKEIEHPLLVNTLRYYAGWADKITGLTIPISSDKFGYTLKHPIGVVGSITPWNFPLANASWKFAPALAAGCCIIMKPSELSPLSALFLAKLFKQAGYPPGVVQVINGWGRDAGRALAEHSDVDMIGFTGSSETGRAIIKAASVNMKKTIIEAGGKSALIVFDDADIEQAAKWAMAGGMGNAGQICSANARILVQEGACERFIKAFSTLAKSSKIGMPFDESTAQGPQVSKMQFDKILGYMEEAQSGGAELVTGGSADSSLPKGYFIQPTIYSGVTTDMKLFREEIFGPVVAITKFGTEAEAVALANDSIYGLAGMVFTQNLNIAMRTASRLQTGMVWINESNNFNAKLPFGGVKQSGLGRELGASTLDAYLEEKAVHVNLGLRL